MLPEPRASSRVRDIGRSAIHEMTRLSQDVEGVAFLSWARPTSDKPDHIKEGAVSVIRNGLVGGYSETPGLPALREEIVRKLKRDNNVDADASSVLVTVGAIEGLAAAAMAVIDPGDEALREMTRSPAPDPTASTVSIVALVCPFPHQWRIAARPHSDGNQIRASNLPIDTKVRCLRLAGPRIVGNLHAVDLGGGRIPGHEEPSAASAHVAPPCRAGAPVLDIDGTTELKDAR